MKQKRKGLNSVMEIPWDTIMNGHAKPKAKQEEVVFAK